MKQIFILITLLITTLFGNNIQNIQIISANNKDKSITPHTIEQAFKKAGFVVDSNNDMNKPFLANHKKTHYPTYHLVMFRDNEYSKKLLDKKDNFGFLTPLTMSIWESEDTIYAATLSLEGLSRTSQIDTNDKDLVEYFTKITNTLKNALPLHTVTQLKSKGISLNDSLSSEFTIDFDNENGKDIEEIKEEIQEEFEGELESFGFKLPNFIDINEEFYELQSRFDFYDTFSLCKIDVIFHASLHYPSAGSYAPCSIYMYKLKSEDVIRIGFLSVDNWIKSLNIEHDDSLRPLLEAQSMVENIIKELNE